MGVKLLREFVRQVLLEKREPFDMARLKALKSRDDIEEYLDFHAKVLGAGVGRTVYDVGDGTVIKWAQNKGGVKANKREATVSSCAVPNAPVVKTLEAGPGYIWIMCDKVQHIVGKKLDRALKATVGLDDVDDLMWFIADGLKPGKGHPYQVDKGLDVSQREAQQRLYKTNEWYHALFDTIKACKLNPHELHGDNWGLDVNGDLVLLDAGS